MGICELVDVDPVFVQVAKTLYGDDVDARELWAVSKNMDAADVHVPAAVKAPTAKQRKHERELARTGLAASTIAGVGGVHALYLTARDSPKALRSGGKAALAGAAGWTALHTTELIGDGLAARAQKRALDAATPPKPPKKVAEPVGKAVLGFLRPVKTVMTEGQQARHTAALARGARTADWAVRGGVVAGTAAAAHHIGRKSGINATLQGRVAKVNTPVAGVKPINSGGLSQGLGRHGRLIGGKTPHPVLQPVAKAPTGALKPVQPVKPIVATPMLKSLTVAKAGGRGARFLARNGQRVLKTTDTHFGPVEEAAAHSAEKAPKHLTKTELRARYEASRYTSAIGGGAYRPRGTNEVHKSLTWTGEISKVDTDKRVVFGWCSLSQVDGRDVVDLQGDYLPLEEIEKSAYRYVIDSRKGGDMHKRVSKTDEPLHTADLIESFVVTPDKLAKMGLAPTALPLGWWVGMKVNDDEQWARVKSGERRAFSIHGTGSRSEMAA